MSHARKEQWNARLRRLSAIELARVAIMDYAGADRALALRRHAQQLWAREIYRHAAR